MKKIDRERKSLLIQAFMIITLYSILLAVFNFKMNGAGDLRGICEAAISALLPIIIDVYKDKKKWRKQRES